MEKVDKARLEKKDSLSLQRQYTTNVKQELLRINTQLSGLQAKENIKTSEVLPLLIQENELV